MNVPGPTNLPHLFGRVRQTLSDPNGFRIRSHHFFDFRNCLHALQKVPAGLKPGLRYELLGTLIRLVSGVFDRNRCAVSKS